MELMGGFTVSGVGGGGGSPSSLRIFHLSEFQSVYLFLATLCLFEFFDCLH